MLRLLVTLASFTVFALDLDAFATPRLEKAELALCRSLRRLRRARGRGVATTAVSRSGEGGLNEVEDIEVVVDRRMSPGRQVWFFSRASE